MRRSTAFSLKRIDSDRPLEAVREFPGPGVRPRTLLTLHGIQTIRRRYCRCSACKHSECPEDASLGILPGRRSAAIAEKACHGAAVTPFDRATDPLYRRTGIHISADGLEATAVRQGTEVCEEARRAAELPVERTATPDEAPSRVYFLADGAILNTRSEGWKENKLGMAFSEGNMEKCGCCQQERIRIRKKDFVTSFAEGIVPMKKLLRLMAARNCAYQAREVVIVSDGAPWIENIFGEIFTRPTHILDWYHAVEHLWTCANAIFGKGSEQASQWVKRYKQLLWTGWTDELLTDLFAEAATARNQTPFLELHGYLRNRRQMIRYDEFRQRGLFIGSGAIESANRYATQSLLKRSGTRWSIPGANAIAHLSAARPPEPTKGRYTLLRSAQGRERRRSRSPISNTSTGDVWLTGHPG